MKHRHIPKGKKHFAQLLYIKNYPKKQPNCAC